MTDKERLAEAIDLVDWLIEQAERTQELEKTVERYQSGRNVAVTTKMKMDELEKQNKRYREALERIKDNIPLEFKHKSEYEAKKNVIRLINIQKEVDEALEGEE